MMDDNFQRTREALAAALALNELDIDAILQLSSELAKQDPDNVRFSTDAAIISRLGRELVAKQETAVAELVKNSYDADASEVTLTFENVAQRGGLLTVEDNGLGMTREQLIAGFMRLSSADKIETPFSIVYGRRRAGRKGIGRFAVQRLGASLVITTQTSEGDKALQIEIDWSTFTSGRDLSSIANRITSVPKQRNQGTTLSINLLQESWSEASIRRVYRYVSELLQPFPLRTLKALNKNTPKGKDIKVDPGFKVELWRIEKGELDLIADEEQSIFSHSLAEVEGYVDEHGKGFWTMKSKKYQVREEVFSIGKERESPIPFSYLRNVSIKAYYFIWQSNLVPRSMYATLRALAQEKAGIRIYRNGFRVPPYGEPQDDWLGLDASTRARDILPPHANTNYFGFVEIIDPEGNRFDETSSREGLLENDAFKELQSFCTRVLKATALQIAEARGRKQTSSQKDWNKKNGNPADAIKAAAEKLAAAAAAEEERKRKIEEAKQEALHKKESDDKSDPQGNVKNSDSQYDKDANEEGNSENSFAAVVAQTAAELLAANEEQRQRNEDLLAELGMLRVLASLGLAIGEFTHEVRQTLDGAALDAQSLSNSLPTSMPESMKALRLKNNIERFTTYASYFDRTITDNANRELSPHNLRVLVNRFIETVNPSAVQAGIVLSKKIVGYELFTPPMHSSELSSLLFNFYTNSKKAIIRADNSSGKIQISVGSEDDKLYLEFSDNGDGIPENNQDKIFDAFFTTSTPTGVDATEEEELQGTGLGLKIVKDIVESYNGEISIVEPPTDFKTCIRVEFPLYSTEENDD